MFGKKMELRKKAMEAMDGGEMEIAIKKKPMPESMEGMDGAEAKEGFEQFMVTPEEKKMILEMRGQGEGEEEIGEEMEGMGVEIEMPMKKSGAY